MKERLSRLELRAAKKRQLALEAMSEVGSPSSSSQTLPPQRAGSPALVVIAEDNIPEVLLAAAATEARSPSDPRRTQAGIEIPGAQMSNPKPVLSVRTK